MDSVRGIGASDDNWIWISDFLSLNLEDTNLKAYLLVVSGQ